MTREQCFEIWAPDNSPWSAWAKPVLFSQMEPVAATSVQQATARPPLEPEPVLQLPEFERHTALVVELAGPAAVRAGLALANRGWRPVPLFNATTGPSPLVDVAPTIEALRDGASAFGSFQLKADAPPAFLIDSRRMTGSPTAGSYDNRSIVLPQDFPSATMLRAHGISAATLVEDRADNTREDLSHVLLRWREGGVALQYHTVAGHTGRLTVSPPSQFRKAWYRMIALFGLRRNNVGGFGGTIPQAPTGGSGGGYRGFG